jgi:hypothetical protein
MLRAYHQQRRRGGDNPLGVGIVPLGAIFYVQASDMQGRERCVENPWMVVAFRPGERGAARRDPDTGRWEGVRTSRTDTAVVRSLRDGRERDVAVSILVAHDDQGLSNGATGYPSLPRLDLHPKIRREAQSSVARKG